MSTFGNLTPASVRALESSKQWAARSGADHIGPEHLLFALLDEEEGRAAQLLTGAGLDLAAFRATIPAGDKAIAADFTAPLSPSLDKLLSRASALAAGSSADRCVATEHLLLALIEETKLAKTLRESGADVDRVVESLRQPDVALPMEQDLELSVGAEGMDAARILDANANRAREALRVIEDYCRFALEDVWLTRQLKEHRHELSQLLATALKHDVEARDTVHDIGTGVSTAHEQERRSLLGVVRANFKRLQESLRSLEEYGKLCGPDVGQRIERLRYESYTLERVVLLGARSREQLESVCLYVLLTGSLCAAAIDWTIKEAAAGGARLFQLREKELPDQLLLERARDVRRWTRQQGALFIVNDRPDIARLAEADGVHLGQEDVPVKDARRILGPDAMIGVSTHSIAQAHQAMLDGASYIGVGPTFPSDTKRFADFPGLGLVRDVGAQTTFPVFAIGGISMENVDQVLAAGGRRVAVSGAICRSAAPREAAAALLQRLQSSSTNSPIVHGDRGC